MANKAKQKRRLKKSLCRMRKEIDMYQWQIDIMKTDAAIRKIFVRHGILNNKGA